MFQHAAAWRRRQKNVAHWGSLRRENLSTKHSVSWPIDSSVQVWKLEKRKNIFQVPQIMLPETKTNFVKWPSGCSFEFCFCFLVILIGISQTLLQSTYHFFTKKQMIGRTIFDTFTHFSTTALPGSRMGGSWLQSLRSSCCAVNGAAIRQHSKQPMKARRRDVICETKPT